MRRIHPGRKPFIDHYQSPSVRELCFSRLTASVLKSINTLVVEIHCCRADPPYPFRQDSSKVSFARSSAALRNEKPLVMTLLLNSRDLIGMRWRPVPVAMVTEVNGSARASAADNFACCCGVAISKRRPGCGVPGQSSTTVALRQYETMGRNGSSGNARS